MAALPLPKRSVGHSCEAPRFSAFALANSDDVSHPTLLTLLSSSQTT